jgi:hypothetical protein
MESSCHKTTDEDKAGSGFQLREEAAAFRAFGMLVGAMVVARAIVGKTSCA